MKYFFSACVFLLIGFNSLAQNEVLLKIPPTRKVFSSFIPAGFDTLATATGDLDKDKIDDLVMVLRANAEDSADLVDELPERILIVLLKKENQYVLAVKTQTAILCRQCGGVMGDPFAGIDILKGILGVHHYGGSAWRWEYDHKFRYQQNDFFLIGETTRTYFNADYCEKLDEFVATSFKDVNLVTGAYEQKKVSEKGCKLLVNKKGKQAVKPLKKLTEFKIEN